MDDLVTWLRQQLDEDERVAKSAIEGPWQVGASGEVETVAEYGTPGYERHMKVTCDAEGILPSVGERDAAHIVRHDPDRVLCEVEAKRRILARHASIEVFGSLLCIHCGVTAGGAEARRAMAWPCPELRDLADPYSDRPGYLEEWRP